MRTSLKVTMPAVKIGKSVQLILWNYFLSAVKSIQTQLPIIGYLIDVLYSNFYIKKYKFRSDKQIKNKRFFNFFLYFNYTFFEFHKTVDLVNYKYL